ncbi:MAG: hypothetical protein U9R29_04575 [Thermodesulfobacteriota bacterium]|nr:hypothetical protein [Thermodesulfobacteriota bacterium]
MPINSTSYQISPQLENSLLCSIEHYQAILLQLQMISNSLTVSDANLEELIHDFNAQQAAAQQHDANLLELLRCSDVVVAKHPLYVQRSELIAQVLDLNHLLLPKIDGIMALISSELAGLKSGRALLGRYKQSTHNQGRIVKSRV